MQTVRMVVLAGFLAIPTGACRPLILEDQAPDPPNFIVILVDDLGWADLGYGGSDLHETPNLDRFARKNLRFTDAYASAPVCTPTRAALLTGKFPARLHMTIWRESTLRPSRRDKPMLHPQAVSDLPHAETTIAEALKGAGYRTAHVGKWHLGDASHFPETHGFDINIGATHWGAPNTFYYPFSGDTVFRDWRYVPDLEPGKPGDYLTDRLTDKAIEVVETFKEVPFFLHLSYHTVHTPIEGKPEVAERYSGKIRDGMRHRNPHLAAMVHSLDENVGRLLARVDSLGLSSNTVVIFTSDNGGYTRPYRGVTVTDNSPLRSGKGSLYEGGIRVPMIVRWPGVTAPGGVTREPVATMDLYPTILEIAGLKPEAEVDGISIVPNLRNPEKPLGRETLYWHYPHYYPTTSPVSALRSGNWKLLEYHTDGKVELYDLVRDLGEEQDLSNDRPEVASRLLKDLRDWRTAVDAQMPTRNPDWTSKRGK